MFVVVRLILPCFLSQIYWLVRQTTLLCLLQIATVEEAKRFYPLFRLGANVALIFLGRTVKYFSSLRRSLGPGVDGWALSLKAMMSMRTMESLKFLVSSRYIRDLATLVIAYGISINLVEVTWKSKLKVQVNLSGPLNFFAL
ncbi:hypothetical protein Vadar_030416 [Vaccinium darrowii]|uniref:Uncharacterized protein n=1 Tax=Vaccinium darrowii TaxID=229202 RepID=A0ACB7XLS5_9ERIC|nr:hypothetical protein Vadar_030416 [Vaccinium darrowii]